MNQERFDELTKGFATGQLSRGQVLKGVAASLLLTGSLGALATPALAQATDCVSICKGLFRKNKKKRKKCLSVCEDRTCPSCGTCKTLNIDNAAQTISVENGSCEDSCATGTLCTQANQDADYLKLSLHLWGKQYVTAGDPESFEVYEDGTKKRSLLATRYAVEGTDNTAVLFYIVDEATGESGTHAVILQNEVPQAVVGVGVNGSIEQVSIADAAASSTNLAATATAPACTNGIFCCDSCEVSCKVGIAASCAFVTAVFGALVVTTSGLALLLAPVVAGGLCALASEGGCKDWCDRENKKYTQEDEQHCGGCNKDCRDGNAHCCEGQCWNKNTSDQHCGKCGVFCRIGAGHMCCRGTCKPAGECCGAAAIRNVTNIQALQVCGDQCCEVCCNGVCCAQGEKCVNGQCAKVCALEVVHDEADWGPFRCSTSEDCCPEAGICHSIGAGSTKVCCGGSRGTTPCGEREGFGGICCEPGEICVDGWCCSPDLCGCTCLCPPAPEPCACLDAEPPPGCGGAAKVKRLEGRS